MPHKREDIAQLKLKILDYMIANPDCNDRELAKKFEADYRTMGKYRRELNDTLSRHKTTIEEKINVKISKPEGIWSRITNLLK